MNDVLGMFADGGSRIEEDCQDTRRHDTLQEEQEYRNEEVERNDISKIRMT